jgi:hypothetical protein
MNLQVPPELEAKGVEATRELVLAASPLIAVYEVQERQACVN